MQTWRIWIFGSLLALGGASCRSSDAPVAPDRAPATPAPAQVAPRPVAPAAPAFTDIEPGLDALRARFQEDDGMVRVIMLVAPT